MEVNTKFDYMDYTIIAEGIVLSPGHVESVIIDVQGMELGDVPTDDLKALREEARSQLVSVVYESLLDF